MLIEQSLDWWRRNSGQVVSFDHLQPNAIFLKWPTSERSTPVPMIIGAATIQADEMGGTNPSNYSDLLASDWRDYGLAAVKRKCKICHFPILRILNWYTSSPLGAKALIYIYISISYISYISYRETVSVSLYPSLGGL